MQQSCFFGVLVAVVQTERCFVSNGNAYDFVLGGLLNFLKILYYISTLQLTFKKQPRVLTYLDFCAKAGAHSRGCHERTRRI